MKKSGAIRTLIGNFSKLILPFFSYFPRELKEFIAFFNSYLRGKTLVASRGFEHSKNSVVKSVLLKRGKLNRMFLHVSAMGMFTVGVAISPFLSESNPFSKDNPTLSYAQEAEAPEALSPEDVFDTKESKKSRSEIIEYTVQKGDTISIIAKRFGISDDTIKWENSLKSDDITVGDTLRILPVPGIAHKVARGDTVYSIAKKYDTNPQGIVDFPFNDFVNPQTFSLVEGQILIVPDGVRPEEKPTIIRRRYVAGAPSQVGGGGFTWPVQGSINQFYAWYHPALDIGADVGTPIAAAHSGTVSEVHTGGWNGGYGVHVIVQGSNGYSSLYAHLSGVNVSVGDSVVAGGTTVGWVGMTGRTTGPHLHFEIRGSGGFSNPLSFLK